MTAIDYFAWVVLIVIIVTAVVVVIALCQLPGKQAIKNNHPHAKAINLAGWFGMLLSLGVVWVLALIWANLELRRPGPDLTREDDEIELRLRALEDQVCKLNRIAELERDVERLKQESV